MSLKIYILTLVSYVYFLFPGTTIYVKRPKGSTHNIDDIPREPCARNRPHDGAADHRHLAGDRGRQWRA